MSMPATTSWGLQAPCNSIIKWASQGRPFYYAFIPFFIVRCGDWEAVEVQAHHRCYNSARWGDSCAHTATVAVCQRSRSVPVPIELMILSRAVHQKPSFHHHTKTPAHVALQLQQDLTSAEKWRRVKE